MKIIPETMGIHLYVVVGISHDENTCTTVSFHQRREVGALGTYNIADTRHVLLKYLYTYIYIYNVWKTCPRSILRGVGSFRYHDTIHVWLYIEKASRWDEKFVIQQSVLFLITLSYTWCCCTNHFRRIWYRYPLYLCFYDLKVRFRNCSDSVVLFLWFDG